MNSSYEYRYINDPLTGQPVEMLSMCVGPLQVTAVPARCMDLYELYYDGIQISLTDRKAGIIDPDYVCSGAESFGHSFFAGMLTTCGLIQAGRPCTENGRDFGLHGSVAHLPARSHQVRVTEDGIVLTVQVEERHEEGENLLLERTYSLTDNSISWHDHVTNLGERTPFMMMYHINFGAPFLYDGLKVETAFAYEEDRDTKSSAGADTILRMLPPEAGKAENVYYTRPAEPCVKLTSEKTGLKATLSFSGFEWMGVWKNYAPEKYGLGLEPCACPGLGRVGAAERGLLPVLEAGQTHESSAALHFERIREAVQAVG